LSNPFVGEKAADALRAFGPAAEKELLTALAGNDRDGRLRAARLLKDLGSTEALGPLKSAGRDRDQELANAAWDAARTVAFHPVKPYVPPESVVAAPPRPQ